MRDSVLLEIARHEGKGEILLPRCRFTKENSQLLTCKVFVPTCEWYREIPCFNGCGDTADVFRRGKCYVAVCTHGPSTEERQIASDEVELLAFDRTAFEEALNKHRDLRTAYTAVLDCVRRGVLSDKAPVLGAWAAKYVSSYDREHGVVTLSCGKQRTFSIPAKSAKAWNILERLFTSEHPEGLEHLPTNWKSHFVRKVGSSGVTDTENDLVKISGYIRPHLPGKGRGSDGFHYFCPVSRVKAK